MIWSSEASLIIFLIFQVKKESLLGYIFFLFQFKMKTKTEAYKFSLKKQLCFPLYYLKILLEQKGLKPPLDKRYSCYINESDHRQSGVKGYKNQASKIKACHNNSIQT